MQSEYNASDNRMFFLESKDGIDMQFAITHIVEQDSADSPE
jgi:hypothetical protein